MEGSARVPDVSRPAKLAEDIIGIFRKKPTARCALLLDPMLRDARVDLDRRRAEYGAQPSPSVQIRLAPGRVDPSNWPVLIDVDLDTQWGRQMIVETVAMASEDWDQRSLRQGKGHRVCGWLASNRSARELASHLAPRFLHIRPTGQRTLLRFHDPSVFRQAWQILSPAQQGKLLGRTDCWIALGPDGLLTPYAAPANVPVDGSFALDAEQWMRLDHIGPINRALARLPARPDEESLRLAADALVRARGYGFDEPEDLVEFAWRAFTVSPRFDDHAAVSQRIAARQAGDSFGYALADVSETQWNHIAMDFDAGTAP